MTADSTGRSTQPSPEELARLLGPARDLWTRLRERILADGHAAERWVYGGRKYGWSCRLERGRKGILYMTADAGHFRVGLALSDAGRSAVLASDLPAHLGQELAGATKAMEGWPLRLPVRTTDDLEVALRLVEIKLST